MQTTPNTSSTMPRARIQPQPRIPSALRSKALTNLETPENRSHTVNRMGRDIIVNQWLNSRNSDMTTVSTPSSSSQPEPRMNRLVPAKMTISTIPAMSMRSPRTMPADIAATS